MQRVLIVFGEELDDYDAIPPILANRLEAAAGMLTAERFDAVILSGGVTKPASLQSRSEAAVMKGVLVEKGIEEALIYLDARAVDTYENVANALEILRGLYPSEEVEAHLLSDTWHTPRIMNIFRGSSERRFRPIERAIKGPKLTLKRYIGERLRILYTCLDPTGKTRFARGWRAKEMKGVS